MSSAQITLKKCGVRFQPPAVIVTYMTKGKMHRRTMPLRNFNKRSGVPRTATELKSNKRHSLYLEKVPLLQLQKLITIIRDKLNGLSLEESLEKNKGIDKVDPNEDLNKCDEETLVRKKTIMESSFEAHRKKPGDTDFTYDTEVDFDGGVIESCEWDSDNDGDEGF